MHKQMFRVINDFQKCTLSKHPLDYSNKTEAALFCKLLPESEKNPEHQMTRQS